MRAELPAPRSDEPTDPELVHGLPEACVHLASLGFDCHPSTLSRAVKGGKIGAQREKGQLVFTRKALDAFTRHLKPKEGEAEDRRFRLQAVRKSDAETRISEAEATTKEVRLRQLMGELLERERVETEWAAAAQLLKSSFESWAHEAVDVVLEVANGDPERQPELLAYLLESTEDFLAQFAVEREWTVDVGEEE
jgi:hypothetical protein